MNGKDHFHWRTVGAERQTLRYIATIRSIGLISVPWAAEGSKKKYWALQILGEFQLVVTLHTCARSVGPREFSGNKNESDGMAHYSTHASAAEKSLQSYWGIIVKVVRKSKGIVTIVTFVSL